MSRRHAALKRECLPDPKFHNLVVAKFTNALMYDGKKAVAEAVVYDAIDSLAKSSKRDGIEAFNEAINNVKPFIEVKSRRVGGATYQVPDRSSWRTCATAGDQMDHRRCTQAFGKDNGRASGR
jgi:small subunit ribosomal protein S7